MYLLDTDVVSNFRKNRPHPNLLKWFAAVPPEEIAISTMTVFEVQSGASAVRPLDPAKADEIEAWLDGFLLNGFHTLPVDIEIARLYGRMFVTPSLKSFVLPDPNGKRPKSGVDLILAATAIVHGATLVTINRKHFVSIHDAYPLPSLYDPFSAEWVIRPR